MTLRVLRSVLNGTPHFGCGVFRAAQKARGAFGAEEEREGRCRGVKNHRAGGGFRTSE